MRKGARQVRYDAMASIALACSSAVKPGVILSLAGREQRRLAVAQPRIAVCKSRCSRRAWPGDPRSQRKAATALQLRRAPDSFPSATARPPPKQAVEVVMQIAATGAEWPADCRTPAAAWLSGCLPSLSACADLQRDLNQRGFVAMDPH